MPKQSFGLTYTVHNQQGFPLNPLVKRHEEACMTRANAIALFLAAGLGGCATPDLTNLTPTSTARSLVPLYPLRAQVDGRGNRIAHVNAVIHGMPWSMMALPSGQHAVGYFADTCETNIPYHFSVGYQRRNLLGSGYSSTVQEKRFPEASGYVLNITGDPAPKAVRPRSD